MKVAIVHNHPIHYKHMLFSEMKRQGLDFDVLFLAGQSSIRHEAIGLSEDHYRAHIGWPGQYETAPAWRRMTFPWKKLASVSPDVVIISGYYAVECWSAWLWASLAHKPIILWFESNEFDYRRHWPKEFVKRIFCQRVARAHVYGTTNKEYLMKLGIPEYKIDLKRAVVEIGRFAAKRARLPRTELEPKRLLYVGRLAPEKNLSFLLRAFATATRGRGSNIRLLIAGSGPCEATLRSEADTLGIRDTVDFLGYTPQKDLPRLYEAADFFILPSTREPWGLVALEAMLARLPVLISKQCGCARDLVTPGNGWTFSPYRPQELVLLLQTLPHVDFERLTAMGEVSLKIALQYSASNCAKIIIRSITLVLNQTDTMREIAADTRI